MTEQLDYGTFRAQYEERHPASVPARRKELSPFPGWLWWATLFMFVCSALLSGVHTVPVVRAGIPDTVVWWLANIAAGAAFVAVEAAIFLATFAMIGGHSGSMRGILGLSTLAALVANIYSVINTYNHTMIQANADYGTLLVAVVVGVLAPGIAFMSGKMFVNIHTVIRNIDKRAEATYLEAQQAWDAEINAAWDKYDSRVQAAVQRRQELDAEAQRRQILDAELTMRQNTANEIASPASIVERHLSKHPEDLDKSLRELADQLNVSRGTVANVKKSFRQNGHSMSKGVTQ